MLHDVLFHEDEIAKNPRAAKQNWDKLFDLIPWDVSQGRRMSYTEGNYVIVAKQLFHE